MVFGGGGKFHITGGVQRSLNGVLNNANDEANADDLHGNIIGNAKQRAGHGDEQQRTARNTGSAAYQQQLKELEAAKTEQENLQIIQLVRSMNMKPDEFAAFLRSGALNAAPTVTPYHKQEDAADETR